MSYKGRQWGLQDGVVGKVLATKPDDQSSLLNIHIVERGIHVIGEN